MNCAEATPFTPFWPFWLSFVWVALAIVTYEVLVWLVRRYAEPGCSK
jgi:hypothetical protein